MQSLIVQAERLVTELRRVGRACGGDAAAQVPTGEAGVLARNLYRERASRRELINAALLGEPAWDILLDLFASEMEGRAISVSSACIASGVPATTALRYLGKLESRGLAARVAAEGDRRRWNICLTPEGRAAMQAALERIGYLRAAPAGAAADTRSRGPKAPDLAISGAKQGL
jgi:DNA-binding MarR family transcriptional regulator